MKRKIASAMILLFVFFSGVVAAGSANGQYAGFDIIKIFSANKELQPEDVPAINFKGRTLVPIGVLRQLGADVKWDAKRKRVDVTMPVRTVPVLTAEQLDSLKKYVYKVTVPPSNAHPKGGQASAFLIEGHMVTNAHVGADSSYMEADIDGAKQTINNYDFVNTNADIMGFTVAGGKALPYSTDIPEVGDPVYDLSFPLGVLTVTEGQVYGITQGPNDVTQIVHTAKTEPGSSGGILLDGRGRIIGMNETIMTGGDFYANFAVPIKYVIDELK